MFGLGDSGVLAERGNCKRPEQRYAWEVWSEWQLSEGSWGEWIEEKGRMQAKRRVWPFVQYCF
jgi:hypothetical protein